jgi:alpha-L-fucosidase
LGDFRSPEQTIPATGLPYDWETCMTMNGSWGYHAGDDSWKPAATLIQNLVDIASKGGNFLLNIGPKADGTVPPESVVRLAAVGDWMRIHGESIYATTASPFEAAPAWGRFTRRPGRLYAHVFDWPQDGQLCLPPIRNEIDRIRLLSQPEVALNYRRVDGAIVIEVPAIAPDPFVSVIALDVAGPPS